MNQPMKSPVCDHPRFLSLFLIICCISLSYGLGWNRLTFDYQINPRAARGYDFGTIATFGSFCVNSSRPVNIHLIRVAEFNKMKVDQPFESYQSRLSVTEW